MQTSTQEHSGRISLATIKNGRVWCSFNEGEYRRGGLRAAVKDAELMALGMHEPGVTHIGVIAFPVATNRTVSRVLARFPVRFEDQMQPGDFLDMLVEGEWASRREQGRIAEHKSKTARRRLLGGGR